MPILSKMCERVALSRLVPYLESNKRLSITQSGNKKLHLTETSLIRVRTTEAILSSIDKNKLTAVVLLNMSKAFDSINHEIILNKLQDILAFYPLASLGLTVIYLKDIKSSV